MHTSSNTKSCSESQAVKCRVIICNYTEAAFLFHSAATKLYEDVLCVSKPIYSHMLLIRTSEYEQARFISAAERCLCYWCNADPILCEQRTGGEFREVEDDSRRTGRLFTIITG